jgi:hypothetical protein
MKVAVVLCYENNNGDVTKGRKEEREPERKRDARQSGEVSRGEIGDDKSF